LGDSSGGFAGGRGSGFFLGGDWGGRRERAGALDIPGRNQFRFRLLLILGAKPLSRRARRRHIMNGREFDARARWQRQG
jgi:hypothetical protein